MPTNNFKPFATGAGANVTTQSEYEALSSLVTGFQAGKAASAQINKALRQSSFISSALAQYVMNKSGSDVLDNGDVNAFITLMSLAFGKDYQKLDATLTALAALTTGANKLPYFTGMDAAAQTDLTQVGRDIIGKNTVADVLTYLAAAPLASPTFTGDPKAPTPATTDSDNSIATTAFVQAVISALSLGNASQKTVGNSSGQIPDMSYFASALASAGYQRTPGGVITQFGSFNVSGSANVNTTDVAFPIVFPTAVRSVTAIISTADPSQRFVGFDMGNTSLNKARFTYVTPTANSIYWTAIGY